MHVCVDSLPVMCLRDYQRYSNGKRQNYKLVGAFLNFVSINLQISSPINQHIHVCEVRNSFSTVALEKD